MNSVSIHNFGCRVNQAEAFGWAEELQAFGFALEKDWSRSDVIVINSCTLTGRADRDVRRFIHKAARDNPRARLIITGCCAERAREEWQNLPGVWMVVRNSEKAGLAGRLAGAAETHRRAGIVSFRSRALIKVQDGCDFRCAYCVIPSVRGKSVSYGEKEIMSRVRDLVNKGYREIVLAGIHLSSYGLDLDPKRSLLELLRAMETVEGLVRIRLSSLDPRFLDGPLAKHISGSPRILPHFHLSLQNGSERILRRMGRPGGGKAFAELLNGLRKASPSAALGADIMVGFPGETDEDFETTREFLTRSPLSYFHVFPYSPRRGTAAALMEQVDDGIKKRRAAELRTLSRRKNLEFRKNLLGRELDAVIIEKKDRGAKVLTGNYIQIRVPLCAADEREMVTVRINGTAGQETWGEILT